ncbi:MAG: hypothetical protein AB8G22_23420, partial [Saprospiraceae bacterium]
LNNANGEIVITIRDYQPDNPPLENLRLQYRRLGDGSEWDDVPLRHIKDLDAFVTPQVLADHNAGIPNTQIPEYFFVWQMPDDDFVTYPDGEYELRVVAKCTNSETISNSVGGRINRSGLRLFGNPEPADGVWTEGDKISFSFNKNLNCSLIDNPDFVMTNFKVVDVTNNSADVPFTVACFNNELVFETIAPMFDYDGHRLEICLTEMRDVTGNGLQEPVSWAFDVITQKLYWTEDTLKVSLYAGETLNITTLLANSTLNENVTNVRLLPEDGAIEGNWLNYSPTGNFDVNPSGRTIVFSINSDEVQDFAETIEVIGLVGRLPKIHIEASIKKRPPYWVVDNPSSFSNDMNLISNWQFTSETPSVDSLDRIAAFIDGQIRGVANISQVGGQFFAAYLSVLGNPTDTDKALEFRVWDASEGQLYIARPVSPILFEADNVIGNTENPTILEVEKATDLVRIIPLNQGWTWFSTNTNTTGMNLNDLLSGIQNPAEGDVIKTDNAVAQYSAATGWYNPSGTNLDNLDPNKGYMIYLENGPDTLYMAGAFAPIENISLNEGWNWVGYPLANQQALNGTVNITPITDGDAIKTRLQDDY